jgi:hypothetical protein
VRSISVYGSRTGARNRTLTDPRDIRAKIHYSLRKNGASKEEIEFLITSRVELNAFTSDQLIEWIEGKLEAHCVKKVVPAEATLIAAARGFARDAIAERYLKVLADDLAKEVDAVDLGGIAVGVAGLLAEHPEMPWDEAVELIVRQSVTNNETSGGEWAE